MTSLYPAFTVHPGESALTAARRLMAMVPDVIFARGEFGLVKEALASEASAYSYGAAHAIRAGRYADETATTHAQVYGDGIFGERFDWPGVSARGATLVQVHDANVTTQTQAEDRADAVLRHAALAAATGEITVAVNCGQELYDVMDVTDAAAGLVSGEAPRAGHRPALRDRRAGGVRAADYAGWGLTAIHSLG